MSTLPLTWELPDQIRQRLGQKGLGQQRAMIAEEHLLLILHKPPRHGNTKRDGVLFWRQPKGLWRTTVGIDGLAGVWRHVKSYGVAEEKLRQTYEQATTAEAYFHLLEELSPLQRAAHNLHLTLQTARDGMPDDTDIIDLRDAAQECDRALELLYIDTKNALDFALARQGEAQARLSLQSVQTAQRLNILAALLLPLTALTSLFGMNLSSGLEDLPPVFFWVIFAAGILAGLLLRHWISPKK